MKTIKIKINERKIEKKKKEMMTGLNNVWRPGVPWFGGCTIFNSREIRERD